VARLCGADISRSWPTVRSGSRLTGFDKLSPPISSCNRFSRSIRFIKHVVVDSVAELATAAMMKLLTSISAILAGLWGAALPITAQVNVTQQHNNLSRDGLYIDSAFTQSAAGNLTRVNAITEPLPPESQLAAQVSGMRTDLNGLSKRLKTLEDAMIDTPSKVLSVPLLRQEVDNIKVNSQKDSEVQAKQIDRVYEQNKWFIGLMVTMAIGLIGLAVSNFITPRKIGSK
jgi:hypothetical protein